MKTTYANVRHPDRLTWILSIVTIGAFAAYLAMIGIKSSVWQSVRLALYLVGIFAVNWIPLCSIKCTVEDEAATLTTPENKKSPMKIADIDRITRIVNRKGRLRYLNIHETGVRFVDVRLLPAQAERLIRHLVQINPNIKVQDRNYI